MSLITKLACTGVAAFALSTATPSTATTTFSFQFDSAGLFVPDGPLQPPIVGTGTFISPVDLAAGSYDLASLPGFQLAFSFADGDTYSTADITTPLSGVSVMVTDLGGGVQRLFFVESGGSGSDGGPHGGVLDLDSGGNFLSFAPTFFGNYLYQETGSAGRYSAVSEGVPEPSTWALMIFGMGAIGIGLRRRRESRPQQPAASPRPTALKFNRLPDANGRPSRGSSCSRNARTHSTISPRRDRTTHDSSSGGAG